MSNTGQCGHTNQYQLQITAPTAANCSHIFAVSLLGPVKTKALGKVKKCNFRQHAASIYAFFACVRFVYFVCPKNFYASY